MIGQRMNPATKTYTATVSELPRNWRVFDAAGRPLGRLASEVAQVLKGKDKPYYSPHLDTGDFVIVVNASKVVVTGKKMTDKKYYRHSIHPGSLKEISFEKMLATHPGRVIELAVWGMLPKNSLGRDLKRKLKVYAGATHPHSAQAKEAAAPAKAGRPGVPRPVKKVRMKKVATAPAAEAPMPSAPVAAAPSVPTPMVAPPPPAPPPAAAPEAATPVASAPTAETTELEPFTPPTLPASRSRRERAKEAMETEKVETEKEKAPEKQEDK